MTPTPEQIKAAHEWCSAGEAAKEWACIDIQTQFVIYTAAAAYAAHCVAEAVAEKDAEIARLRTALQNLNAEIDAFWNADPAAKYHEGRISPYFEQAIINGQIECRAALGQEKKP